MMRDLKSIKLLKRLRLVELKKYLRDFMLEYNEIWKLLKEQE